MYSYNLTFYGIYVIIILNYKILKGLMNINTSMRDLIDIIVGCTTLICGSILIIVFWPIAILVLLLGLLLLMGDLSLYDVRKKYEVKNKDTET